MPSIHASEALKHIRVLDLSRVRSGPTCVRMLADFGADVIRIEPPAGVDPNDNMFADVRKGGDFQNLNRNKRSLTLNLKTKEGISLLHRMVKHADVVVENWRPDVKARLGVDYDTLSAINPRIILASISGYGQDGPYAKRPGFDQIIQGMGGLMSITGEPGGEPVRAGIAVSDSSTGLYAACGIFIALLEREVSGKGQWVHASLLHSMIAMLDFQAARYLVDDEVPVAVGNDHPTTAPMGMFQASDGYLNLGVSGAGQWVNFCRAVGKEEWLGRPEYRDNDARVAHRDQINSEVQALVETETVAHWTELLNAASVPSGPVYSIPEMLKDSQVCHLNVAQSLPFGADGEITLVSQPVVLSRTPADLINAAPDRGEHTEEILDELGFGISEIGRLRADRVI